MRVCSTPRKCGKFFQFFKIFEKKISRDSSLGDAYDARTRHSFSRIFNIRRALSYRLVAQWRYPCNSIESWNEVCRREIESRNLSFSSNLLPLETLHSCQLVGKIDFLAAVTASLIVTFDASPNHLFQNTFHAGLKKTYYVYK